MKQYAVVVDISPSEQFDGNEPKNMALLFALRSQESFNHVGDKARDENNKYKLRKWSGSSSKYKVGFVEHANKLITLNPPQIMLGMSSSSEFVIKKTGSAYWQRFMGSFPEPSSVSKKNKPRVTLGGYKVDGVTIKPFEVLVDDLIILGWYAETLVSCIKALNEINNENVKLDVIIDKLPNEKGDYNKAFLLKQLCHRASNGLLNIVGVVAESDTLQRDLFVDNMAGLYKDIVNGESCSYKHGKDLFKFWRTN